LAAEQRCREYHLNHGLEVAMLRPFSVYGAGQDLDTGYVGMLLAAIRNGVDPILPGQPDFLRDFVHVNDLLQLLIDCIQQPLEGMTVVNAASGRSHTLRALVDDISQLAGYSINASYREPSSDTIRRSCGDISQAAQLFGYKPKRNLSEGLADCIEWVMNTRSTQHEISRRPS
jgi:UDP-glucose 4-epimerase